MKNAYLSLLPRWGRYGLGALALLAATTYSAQAQTPTFTAVVPTPASSSDGVAVADLNIDGKLDLLTTKAGVLNVQLGNGNGTFTTAVSYSIPTTGGVSSSSLAITVADVNRDGKLDVVTADYTNNTVAVLRGNGDGTFQVGQAGDYYFLFSGAHPNGIAVADVDKDGRVDLISSNSGSGGALNYGSVSVLRGNSNGTFSFNNGTSSYPSFYRIGGNNSYPTGLAVVDVNNDTRPDLLVADQGNSNPFGGGGAAVVLLNDGNGGFASPVSYSTATGTTPATGANTSAIAVADVNKDGKPDLLTANRNNNTAGVLIGNGGGTFRTVISFAVADDPRSIAVGDVNGDGKLDLLTSSTFNAAVGILLGNGDGTFQPNITLSGGGSTVVVADVNGDSQLDVLTNRVDVLLNTTASAAPTLTSFSSNSGTAGTSITLTGTKLSGATGVGFNGTAATTFAVVNATTITATVPAGASTGPVTVTTPSGTSNGVTFTITYPDLVVETTGNLTQIAAGTYNSITVRNGGYGTLAGDVVVNSFVRVQGANSELDAAGYVVRGAATFTLETGAYLDVTSPQGISASGATGTVQSTGTRSFSSDASYYYYSDNGQSQVTGNGLPNRVRNLYLLNDSPATITLSQATSVTQELKLFADGNLLTNGNVLTLLSSSTGTALVINDGAGVVQGAVTVQRYIDGSLNPTTATNPQGLGYRHYSAPVSNTTVVDLATSGFTPVLTQSYNTSAMPGTTTPFPTVFGYDQSRLATVNSNYSAFDKGWVVPAAPNTALTPGRGYAVNIGSSQLVDFVGTLNNGDLEVNLTRDAGSSAADAGWALVGNPYPAPLDWSKVETGDNSIDAAMYVVQSTGQYAGAYRTYTNGMDTNEGTPLIAAGQGFFVRVSEDRTSGRLTFSNSQRVTSYADQAAFQRVTADLRPAVRLVLRGAGLADAFVAYAESGATPAFDSQYDATKLPNSTGLNLSSVVGSERLAIDGRAIFTTATTLPLTVGVPAAGTYTLISAALTNLPAGLDAYLRDAQTGQTTKLTQGTSYSFSVTSSEATALVAGRFTLQFGTPTPLATANSLSITEVTVYPNPAYGRFSVLVPAIASASTVQAELLNTLGQVVSRQAAALPATGTTLTVETTGLATGVYTLRLQAGTTTLTKRVVLQ